LVIAHIITMLIAGAYYLPASLIKRLDFEKEDIRTFIKEGIIILFVSTMIIIGTININAKGWTELVIYSFLLSLTYITILAILSGHMRIEIRGIWLLLSKYMRKRGTDR